MCRDIIATFTGCPHTVNSGVHECDEYFRRVPRVHCEEKEEPKALVMDGKCAQCLEDESEHGRAEIERAIELSRQAFEARHPNQEEEHEKHLREALQRSLDEHRPRSPRFNEDEITKAIQESFQASQQHAQRQAAMPKQYIWQAHRWHGCGHQTRSHQISVVRGPEDPEEIVDDEYGKCANCRGESSSAAAGRPPVRAGLEDEDDPVPAYDFMQELDSPDAPSTQGVRNPVDAGPSTSSPSAVPSVSPSGQAHASGSAPVAAAESPTAPSQSWSFSNLDAPPASANLDDEADYESEPEQSKRSSITRSTASQLFKHGAHNAPKYMGDPEDELGMLREEDEDDDEQEYVPRSDQRR